MNPLYRNHESSMAGLCVWSFLCEVNLSVVSNTAITLLRKRKRAGCFTVKPVIKGPLKKKSKKFVFKTGLSLMQVKGEHSAILSPC